MTREQILTYVTAIVTTLEECASDAAESTFYLALGMDLGKWHAVRNLMVASDLISVAGHRVALTDKGRNLALDISAACVAGR